MPHVQSKSIASHGNSTNLESWYGTHDVNDDQHVYVDPNRASVISSDVAKIKSKESSKRKRACKYPCGKMSVPITNI